MKLLLGLFWSRWIAIKRSNIYLLKILIETYKLELEETMKTSEEIYERGEINYSEIDRIMSPTSRFNPEKWNKKNTN